MEGAGIVVYENDLNLRLGLPGTDVKNQEKPVGNKKRTLDEISRDDGSVSVGKGKSFDDQEPENSPSPPKAQIVGWPPVRSYRKNTLQQQQIYVKVSMDGAPYLRKIDIKVYKNYPELLQALETMFKFTVGKGTQDPNMFLLMKIKMVIGCWLEMYHGVCLCHLARGCES